MRTPFTNLAIILLSLISLVHLLRFLQAWEVTVSGVIVPVWVSGIVFVLAGGLALMTWRETRMR